MAEFCVPYGRSQLQLWLPDRFAVEVLTPAPVSVVPDPAGAAREAVARPLGSIRLTDFARARSVVIAIADKTRPIPNAILLPPLLEALAAAGIPDTAITFLIATGLHAAMQPHEFAGLLPEGMLGRFRVISHDVTDRANMVRLGETSRGTPVFMNRLFVQADLRIVVGNIDPHQFMGFSGGVKTAAIGLAGLETINANHALLLDPRADLARYEGNPMRQEVEEIGRMAGVHFAVNAVVNEKKQIVAVLAGDPVEVMRHGIPRVLEIYQVKVAKPFDLMIVSPGGYPKDINLYQGQKALGHACRVAPPGSTVILAAACPEGSGSQSYEDWVRGMESHRAVLDRFKGEGFRIGPHKAFQFARDASVRRLLLVTDMPASKTRELLLTKAESLDSAVGLALEGLAASARIGVMPWGNSTVPTLAA